MRREAEGPAGATAVDPPAGTTGPIWRQTPLAWLAFHPDHPGPRGDPVTRPVDPDTGEVCAKLLALGGAEVAVRFEDWWASMFINRDGQLTNPEGLTWRRGRPIHCHANCAAAWLADPDRYRIQTGFGLNDDIWRQHTWLLDGGGRVVETTVPREVYFGAVLSEELSEFFSAIVRAGQPASGRRLPPRPAGRSGKQPAVVGRVIRDIDRVLELLLEIDPAIRSLPPEGKPEVVLEVGAALGRLAQSEPSDARPPAGFEGGPLAGLASAVMAARDRVIEDGDVLRAASAGADAKAAQARLGEITAGLRVGGKPPGRESAPGRP